MNKYKLKSMTGFGKTVYETKGKKISVEIKSLNSKQLDINARLTNSFRAKEIEIRRILAEKLERGKVDICINIENSGEVSTYSLNKELAKKHYKELKSLSDELKIKGTDFMQLLIRMPDAMSSTADELDDNEWKKLEQAINKSLKLVDEFRLHEGKILEEDFLKRIHLINKLLDDIKKLDKARIDNIKA